MQISTLNKYEATTFIQNFYECIRGRGQVQVQSCFKIEGYNFCEASINIPTAQVKKTSNGQILALINHPLVQVS